MRRRAGCCGAVCGRDTSGPLLVHGSYGSVFDVSGQALDLGRRAKFLPERSERHEADAELWRCAWLYSKLSA